VENTVIPLITAFLAGLVSFLSPCVLPMLPTFAALLGGSAVSPAERQSTGRCRFFFNILFFLSGFTLVFVAMGATASYFGQLFGDYQEVIRKVGAVFMVMMGIHLLGWLNILVLKQEYRPLLNQAFRGPFGAFILGIAFTAGWTPCTGPILAAILAYAGTTATLSQGVLLLFVFSLGFSVPFWIAAFFLHHFVFQLRRLYLWLPLIQRFAGGLMILVGIILYLDWLPKLLGLIS
jgi:cytochrome c-type biogenesis protein